MNSPIPGQTWSIMSFCGRTTFRIDKIENGRIHATNVRGGRHALNLSLRSLVRGRRAARLELEADGSKPYRAPISGHRTAEETKTASDYVRETPPRGLSAEEREQWLQAKREGREWP